MGIGDRLKNLGTSVREAWRSKDPNSYFQYKRGRERKRSQDEQWREDADRRDQEKREVEKRGHEYEERYRAERAAEASPTEPPRNDQSRPQ
jgi:hypothetical protein